MNPGNIWMQTSALWIIAMFVPFVWKLPLPIRLLAVYLFARQAWNAFGADNAEIIVGPTMAGDAAQALLFWLIPAAAAWKFRHVEYLPAFSLIISIALIFSWPPLINLTNDAAIVAVLLPFLVSIEVLLALIAIYMANSRFAFPVAVVYVGVWLWNAYKDLSTKRD